MKRILLGLMIVGLLTGCQPKEEATEQKASSDETTQRKEASRKITVQSLALLSKQDYQNAIAGLDAAIKLDPTNRDAYLVMSQILIKADKLDLAQILLDGGARNLPDDPMIYYMLSTVHQLGKKKLPAALAARRSFELFKNANDKEGAQKAAQLLQSVIAMPDQPNEK